MFLKKAMTSPKKNDLKLKNLIKDLPSLAVSDNGYSSETPSSEEVEALMSTESSPMVEPTQKSESDTKQKQLKHFWSKSINDFPELSKRFKIKESFYKTKGAELFYGVCKKTGEKVVIKRSIYCEATVNEVCLALKANRVVPEHTLPVLYNYIEPKVKEAKKKSSSSSSSSQMPSRSVIFVQPKYGLSLFEMMVKLNSVLEILDLKYVYFQVITALKKLQDSEIYHLDIKEENILIDPFTLKIKIIDFGVSKHGPLPVPSDKIVGSKTFCAPEIYCGSSCLNSLKKHDVWSVGVCLFSSTTGQLPYQDLENLLNGKSLIDVDQIVQSCKVRNIDQEEITNFCDLLCDVFVIDFRKRIDFEDLLASKFFINESEYKSRVKKQLVKKVKSTKY